MLPLIEELVQEKGNDGPALSAYCASTLDLQRAYANAPGLIKGYF